MLDHFIDIDALGPRICIIGPSSSGKSTLATLIGQKTNRKVVHLDQLAHEPNTDWRRRSNMEFIADHDTAIMGDSWIIEGNYQICMPQRFERATSVIWLDPSLFGCICRYLIRCIKSEHNRVGKLQGSTKEFNWALIKHTWFKYPKNKIIYKKILEPFQDRLIKINSMHDLNQYIKHWGL